MPPRTLVLDRTALLAALTRRDATLVCTYLDLEDGSLLPLFDRTAFDRTAFDRTTSHRNEALEARLDKAPGRYARVPLYEREYRLMLAFVDTVEDDGLAVRLDTALSGRGAFRGFAEVLAGAPAEQGRWAAYRERTLAGFAVSWLRSLGVEPDWDGPVPAVEVPEVPWLLQVALRGVPSDSGEALVRTLQVASEQEARQTYLRLARELCEFARVPFRARIAAKADRFVHGGVEIRVEGASVVILVAR